MFWCAAWLLFPALNIIAMWVVRSIACGSIEVGETRSSTLDSCSALLVAAAPLALAELTLLIARARRRGLGGLQVVAAMLANVWLSMILLWVVFGIWVVRGQDQIP